VPVVVTAGMLELWLQQCSMRRTFVKVVSRNLHHATTAW
jgi:hypothetical protein